MVELQIRGVHRATSNSKMVLPAVKSGPSEKG